LPPTRSAIGAELVTKRDQAATVLANLKVEKAGIEGQQKVATSGARPDRLPRAASRGTGPDCFWPQPGADPGFVPLS